MGDWWWHSSRVQTMFQRTDPVRPQESRIKEEKGSPGRPLGDGVDSSALTSSDLTYASPALQSPDIYALAPYNTHDTIDLICLCISLHRRLHCFLLLYCLVQCPATICIYIYICTDTCICKALAGKLRYIALTVQCTIILPYPLAGGRGQGKKGYGRPMMLRIE